MKVLSDERGQTTVLVAVFTAFLFLGLAGLAIDVGSLYREKRMVQAAADAGALAAAAGEASSQDIYTSAKFAATQNGLTVVEASPTAGQAMVAARDGLPGVNPKAYVQVTVSKQVSTFFMGAFTSAFKTITVTATAQASYLASSNACMTALNPNGTQVPYASNVTSLDGSAVAIYGTKVMADIATEGSSHINNPYCGISACGPATEAAGSGETAAALYAWGSGSISASSTSAPSYGTDNSGSTISPAPVLQANCIDTVGPTLPAAPVPAAGCADPTWMTSGTGGGGSYTISPGTYCNFNTANVSHLTMSPGLYIIRNTFSTNSGSTITGSGVTIYLANGVIANANNYTYVAGGATPYGVGNGTTMDISAPTSGTYANIAIWDGNSSSSTPDTFTFGGGAASTFSGNIYAPNTNLVLGNGSGTSSVSSNITAGTIMVLGGSTFDDNYNPGAAKAVAGGVNLTK